MKAMDLRFEWSPKMTQDMMKNILATRELALLGAYVGIDYLMEDVYLKAKMSCPIDTGALLASLYKEIEVDGFVANAHVGHGGKYDQRNPDTGMLTDAYAIERHEFLGTSAKARRSGGTSKWLEKAFNNIKPYGMMVLKEHIAAALEGKSNDTLTGNIRIGLRSIAKRKIAKSYRQPRFNNAGKSGIEKANAKTLNTLKKIERRMKDYYGKKGR